MHTLALYARLQKRCFKKRRGRIGHFSGARQMRASSLAIPSEAPNSRHTILMPVQRKNMKLISLQLISNQKYMPKLYALGSKLFSPGNWDINKSIMVQLHTASTSNTPLDEIAQSLIPPGQTIKNYLTHSKATLITNGNSYLKPMGKGQATSPL